MLMNEAHFPGSVPIDAYGDGGFRFAGMAHKGSIMALPSGIYAWEQGDSDALAPESFARVFRETELPHLMLVGTGTHQILPPIELRMVFREHAVPLEVMDTGAAARTYNVLLSEGRCVGAALVAVG